MAKVTAALRRTKGFSSKLIAWWGNGWNGYSHIDIVTPGGLFIGARSDEVGGKPPGVWPRPADYERQHLERLTLIDIPCDQDQADDAHAWLNAQVGDLYDPGDIIRLITGEEVAATQGHWICSALFTGFLMAGRILKKGPVPPQQVTPDGCDLLCWALGGVYYPQGLPGIDNRAALPI